MINLIKLHSFRTFEIELKQNWKNEAKDLVKIKFVKLTFCLRSSDETNQNKRCWEFKNVRQKLVPTALLLGELNRFIGTISVIDLHLENLHSDNICDASSNVFQGLFLWNNFFGNWLNFYWQVFSH